MGDDVGLRTAVLDKSKNPGGLIVSDNSCQEKAGKSMKGQVQHPGTVCRRLLSSWGKELVSNGEP